MLKKILEKIGFGSWQFNLIAGIIIAGLLAAAVAWVYGKGYDEGAADKQALWTAEKLAAVIAAVDVKDQKQGVSDVVADRYAGAAISLTENQTIIAKGLYDETAKSDPGLDCVIPVDSLRGINATASAYHR